MTDPTSTDSTSPLHQQNPLERFSTRAASYAQYRPSYPAAAIAALLDGLGDPQGLTAADVGAGTGIGARLLGDRGMRVWAVEPNAAMRDAAQAHPRVTMQAGTAAATGLLPQSVDLITCFQAFHWFEPSASLREFQRILRPDGRLALVWNDRDRADPFTAAYTQIIKAASHHHPAEKRRSRDLGVTALQNSPAFQLTHTLTFPYVQRLDATGLLGRATSTSYLPQAGAAFEALVAELTHLHGVWADVTGQVALRYQTQVLLAQRPS